LDRSIHGGLGIMLDDALAGVFAAVCLHGFLPYAESILAPT
jgi:phosphatidylglycerophosphatase A